MSQTLYTKNYGAIEVERSWQNGIHHIVELSDNQGYAHATGSPINSEDELREVLPPGPFLNAAINWFQHRDEPAPDAKKEVVLKGDGSFAFNDGSPITSIGDLVSNIPSGPVLDAAYEWYKSTQAKAKEEEIKAQSPMGKAAKTVATAKATGQVKGK